MLLYCQGVYHGGLGTMVPQQLAVGNRNGAGSCSWLVCFLGRAGAGAAETGTQEGHKGRVHIFFPWLWLRFGLHACLISCCLVCDAHTLGSMQQVCDAMAFNPCAMAVVSAVGPCPLGIVLFASAGCLPPGHFCRIDTSADARSSAVQLAFLGRCNSCLHRQTQLLLSRAVRCVARTWTSACRA